MSASAPTPRLRASLFRHARLIDRVAFTPDGTTLLSASSAISGEWWVTGGEVVRWPSALDDLPGR